MVDDNWGYFLYGGVGMSAATDETLSDGLTGVGVRECSMCGPRS